MKRVKTRGATTPLYREVRVCQLDQIRGGTVIVTDPGPGGGSGPKKLTGEDESNVVVITGEGPRDPGPK
jgi:hypothetical protein